MTVRSSLDRRLVPFREPNSHKTRTEHVQNEEYFSVRREPATVMLVLQLSFRFQLRGALAIYHGEQGLMVEI